MMLEFDKAFVFRRVSGEYEEDAVEPGLLWDSGWFKKGKESLEATQKLAEADPQLYVCVKERR